MWLVGGACTVGLIKYLSTLILICAQPGRVSGLQKKTDPTSSLRSDKKGLKDNNNRFLCIVKKFDIPFGTKSKILISGGPDSDCTVVTIHQTAKFRVRHLNSVIEQTRRGIMLLVFLYIQPILLLLYRFSVKHTVSRPFFTGQNSDILIPPQIAIFEISIIFETEKSPKLVSYIVTKLV